MNKERCVNILLYYRGIHLFSLNRRAVENVAYKKDSWINNKRQLKRHIRNQWTRGHASRAVDGDPTVATQTCTVLDNFYVDRPTLLVDLGQKTRVSGIKIVTWQGHSDGSVVAGIIEDILGVQLIQVIQVICASLIAQPSEQSMKIRILCSLSCVHTFHPLFLFSSLFPSACSCV